MSVGIFRSILVAFLVFHCAQGATIAVEFDPNYGCKGSNVLPVRPANTSQTCAMTFSDIQDVQGKLTATFSWSLEAGDAATTGHLFFGVNNNSNAPAADSMLVFNVTGQQLSQTSVTGLPLRTLSTTSQPVTQGNSTVITYLKAGLAYFLLNSEQYPNGAIRAQFNSTDPSKNTPAFTTVPGIIPSSASVLAAALPFVVLMGLFLLQ